MENLKQILYGVTDFVDIRRSNGYYLDRTGFIPEIERTRYALFLRPRRFGKSLLLSMLQCYYDRDYADRFDELFDGLEIAKAPTPERGQYLVLDFNFSGVDKRVDKVQASFDSHCRSKIDAFASRHAGALPAGAAAAIREAPHCTEKLDVLTTWLKGSGQRLYVLIDEYDNFANTVLAEHGKDAYHELCHGEGFFKQFFTGLKLATTGTDAPVARMFITGVTPITMDDVTSGFNIADNLSLAPNLAGLLGFSHDEMAAMFAYYRAAGALRVEPELALKLAKEWFDGYRFGDDGRAAAVYNPVLALGFVKHAIEAGGMPRDLVDENLRTDYAKIRHIITENRKINGNYHKLEDVIANGGVAAVIAKSFQAREISQGDNFVSLLYYFGLLSASTASMGEVVLRIPNATVAEFVHDFVPRAYEDVNGIDPRLFDIGKGLNAFARGGDWRPAIDAACAVVASYLAVRDAIEGERVVQTALASILAVAHGPYVVRHEQERGGGFIDVALCPQLGRYPEIAAALLIELKYLKAAADATAPALAKIKAAATAQLDRYAAAHDLAREWHLRPSRATPGVPGGTVELRRLVVVFCGARLALCEEV